MEEQNRTGLVPFSKEAETAKQRLEDFKREAKEGMAGYTYQYLHAANYIFDGLLDEVNGVRSVLIEGAEDVDVFYGTKTAHIQLKFCHSLKNDEDQKQGLSKAMNDFLEYVSKDDRDTHYWEFQTTQRLCRNAEAWNEYNSSTKNEGPAWFLKMITEMRTHLLDLRGKIDRARNPTSASSSVPSQPPPPDAFQLFRSERTTAGIRYKEYLKEWQENVQVQGEFKQKLKIANQEYKEGQLASGKVPDDIKTTFDKYQRILNWIDNNIATVSNRFTVSQAPEWRDLQDRIIKNASVYTTRLLRVADNELVDLLSKLVESQVWKDTSQKLGENFLNEKGERLSDEEQRANRTIWVSEVREKVRKLIEDLKSKAVDLIKQEFRKELKSITILSSVDPYAEYMTYLSLVRKNIDEVVTFEGPVIQKAALGMYLMGNLFQTSKDLPPTDLAHKKQREKRKKLRKNAKDCKDAMDKIVKVVNSDIRRIQKVKKVKRAIKDMDSSLVSTSSSDDDDIIEQDDVSEDEAEDDDDVEEDDEAEKERG